MSHICKNFGTVEALKDVHLELRRGEILSLLGENGSGKTTLMNVLSGIYFPDLGEVRINGTPVAICEPRDAFALNIGMVHQHYKLVEVFTAAENIVLGLPGALTINRRALARHVREIADRYGFRIDPNKKVYDMSISEKQTVEIIKVLYRGADILILDEPTAVLTPQETDSLFEILRAMKKDNKSIILITHKLNEVLAVSDRVTVLRKGEYIDTVETCDASIQSLTDMMVGRSVSLEIDRPIIGDKRPVLRITSLTCLTPDKTRALEDVDLEAYGGEILGIAGITGSGQRELCEAITGLHPIAGGAILYKGYVNGFEVEENIVGKSPNEIARKGIALAFVPEDRLGMGLVPSLDMVDNIMLKSYKQRKSFLVDRKTPQKVAERLVEELEIVTPDVFTPIRKLSGGNVQKILVGREIDSNPRLLIVAYPVRGLDINSSYTIYRLLNQQKERGVAVIFIGEDLDVLMEISDRLLVLHSGRVMGVVEPRRTSKQTIGLMMLGHQHPGQEGDKAV
ncbi:MAG: ABC transporter ATP-binding protein [Clostridiaceae bacterium]|nr:ABC transporter ATP-binding protein [Clostridiaceae bacterium]